LIGICRRSRSGCDEPILSYCFFFIYIVFLNNSFTACGSTTAALPVGKYLDFSPESQAILAQKDVALSQQGGQ
jgi:hypothetical protein